MSAFRQSMAAILSLSLVALGVVAAEPPRPPQPPLTNATLQEWHDELSAAYELRDNAFLFEEEAREFGRRMAAWQGAEVVLSLQVERVTKEMVVCDSLAIGGRFTIRNEEEPALDTQRDSSGTIALRIADVVPLEVALRLRGRDTLVVRGFVATSEYQPGRAFELAIAKGQAVAVVSRFYAGTSVSRFYEGASRSTRVARLGELLPTPQYPLQALASRTDGLAVVSVTKEKVAIASSTGSPLLDEAAMMAMQRLENNTREFQGEHRFTFTILRQ